MTTSMLALIAWVSVLTRHAAAQDYRAKITAEVKDSTCELIPGDVMVVFWVQPVRSEAEAAAAVLRKGVGS
jgi:hypothetical protein